MRLFINNREKEILIEALRVYQDELNALAQKVRSGYLAEGFRKDAEGTGDLITKMQNAREDYKLLDEGIKKILSTPQTNSFDDGFIPAIKFCREQTGWYLKDAKEYVEKIRDAR